MSLKNIEIGLLPEKKIKELKIGESGYIHNFAINVDDSGKLFVDVKRNIFGVPSNYCRILLTRTKDGFELDFSKTRNFYKYS